MTDVVRQIVDFTVFVLTPPGREILDILLGATIILGVWVFLGRRD